jgi:cation diffusion facilitator CzcD-associated flavoprotein CzcO
MKVEQSQSSKHIPVVIVGAGFGGMGLAVNLHKSGIRDFVIFERASEVGGTWRDNTYPGVACDVASNLYSLSFAPKHDWSKTHGEGQEIFEYLKGVATQHELYDHIRFNHDLLEARWSEADKKWHLRSSQGEFSCDVLVTAVGPFGKPVIPEFKGADTFQGKAFHTFNWDHDCDLHGKRVAIVGTGATSIQLVPAIQEAVKSLIVFQRTPTHILPRTDIENTPFKKALFAKMPVLQRLVRSWWYVMYEAISGLPQFASSFFRRPLESIVKRHRERQVLSDTLREKLTPKYHFGCKRPVMSSTFYPALQQPNVELVTAAVAEVRQDSIVDSDGNNYPIDVLIYSTGFRVPHDFYDRLIGEKGESLTDTWGSAPKAFLGGSVSGFPNLFLMGGPFSSAGNQSAIYMLESQARYITQVIKTIRARGLVAVDVREDVQNGFFCDLQNRSRKTTWVTGGCTSYYQNADGGNTGLWPNWSFLYRWKIRKFDPHLFDVNAIPADSESGSTGI